MNNLTLGEDFKNQTHEAYSICTDGKYWFVYSESKGLMRADRKENEGISDYKSDEEPTLFPGLTMFCHKDLLLVRHQGAPDEPFVAFDKETLKPVEGQEPFKFAESDKVTLKWTPQETQYSTNHETGNRWCRYLPFFSDGKKIYTLVQYRENSLQSRVIRTVLEVYELNDRTLKLKKQVSLNRYEGATFRGSRYRNEYIRRGSLACNGHILIWHSACRVFTFNVETGMRLNSEYIDDESTSTYDSKENKFYQFRTYQGASDFKHFEITGFRIEIDK